MDVMLTSAECVFAGCRKNWDMPKSFPSAAVAEAYAKPRVDMSRAKITHGRPDLELLRKFCYAKFGWSQVSCFQISILHIQS